MPSAARTDAMVEERNKRARAGALVAGLPDILFPPIGKDMLVLLCLLIILKACAVANCLIKIQTAEDIPGEIASQIRNAMRLCSFVSQIEIDSHSHPSGCKSKMTCRVL